MEHFTSDSACRDAGRAVLTGGLEADVDQLADRIHELAGRP
ncbi:hypothetical protein [Streptomyces sp. NBC_00525]|nr:hypothetical protein [Streptomyces sp. NBC_00525]WUC98111.1 hypothetical protein OG710_31075 [Streptomyces sp. NBC_00525]